MYVRMRQYICIVCVNVFVSNIYLFKAHKGSYSLKRTIIHTYIQTWGSVRQANSHKCIHAQTIIFAVRSSAEVSQVRTFTCS